MCTCVCVYVCVCVCVRVYDFVCVCISCVVHLFVRAYVFVYDYMCVCVCVCVYVCGYICVHMWARVCVCTILSLCTCACMGSEVKSFNKCVWVEDVIALNTQEGCGGRLCGDGACKLSENMPWYHVWIVFYSYSLFGPINCSLTPLIIDTFVLL